MTRIALSACSHGSAQGITELVTIDGAGPFVRKKIPCALARRTVWAALATCSNPGLPRVQATYETPDWFAVVLEFVPGETLEHIVEATGAMPANEAARRTLGICSAVEELHAHSIIHRDLSPTNVVANGDGVHLIDLGTARMTTEPASPHTSRRLAHGALPRPNSTDSPRRTNDRTSMRSDGCSATCSPELGPTTSGSSNS